MIAGWLNVMPYLVLLTLLFISALGRLMMHAAASGLRSHIVLVPFIAAYLRYGRRSMLPPAGPRSLAGALLLTAVGLGALVGAYVWLGSLSTNDYLGVMAFGYAGLLAAGRVLLPGPALDGRRGVSVVVSAEPAALYVSLEGTRLVRDGTATATGCAGRHAASW
jgi:hypothetical protein